MSLREGDVLKRLAGGQCPPKAHPVIILKILGDRAIFSNLTDIEKEDFIHCVIEVEDDPDIVTKKSTFRYQDIKEEMVSTLDKAIENRNIRYCGNLSDVAFKKIITGGQSAENKQIKPKYRDILRSHEPRISASADIRSDA